MLRINLHFESALIADKLWFEYAMAHINPILPLSSETAVKQLHSESPAGLRFIAILKLISAVLLYALALGLFHLLDADIGNLLQKWVVKLHLGSGNYLIDVALEKAMLLSPGQLRAIDAGTFLYATLYVVEGIGLLREKHWAEYLTVIATGLMLPLELYEIARHVTPIKIIVLMINLAIVAYLLYELRCRRKARLARMEAASLSLQGTGGLSGMATQK